MGLGCTVSPLATLRGESQSLDLAKTPGLARKPMTEVSSKRNNSIRHANTSSVSCYANVSALFLERSPHSGLSGSSRTSISVVAKPVKVN